MNVDKYFACWVLCPFEPVMCRLMTPLCEQLRPFEHVYIIAFFKHINSVQHKSQLLNPVSTRYIRSRTPSQYQVLAQNEAHHLRIIQKDKLYFRFFQVFRIFRSSLDLDISIVDVVLCSFPLQLRVQFFVTADWDRLSRQRSTICAVFFFSFQGTSRRCNFASWLVLWGTKACTRKKQI